MPSLIADLIDSSVQIGFVVIAVGLPAFGYGVLYADWQRYRRSLRRALVVLTRRFAPNPYVPLDHAPPCLESLGLSLPCSEEQVMSAYRRIVKQCHPDRGGDLREFLRLQQHVEQALYLARQAAHQGKQGERK